MLQIITAFAEARRMAAEAGLAGAAEVNLKEDPDAVLLKL